MKYGLAIAVVALSASVSAIAAEDEANHCLEAESNQEWAAMAREHHANNTWQRLFALRVGLCAMVKGQQLTVDRASRIFERQRKAAVNKAKTRAPAPSNGKL